MLRLCFTIPTLPEIMKGPVVLCRKLSTQDMQKVVEKGCPNLFRKVVNSAKRLRIHLNLDEGEVSCLLNY